MILNPNVYRYTLDQLKDTVIAGANESPDYPTLTILSLGSHVPFAAVVAYALRPDVFGPTPNLIDLLASTIDFYKYESLTPWSDL
jgi:hypothetical protein